MLRRDQRWVWMLGILCVLAWMAVVMLPWATILPMMAKVVRHQQDIELSSSATAHTGQGQQETLEILRIVKMGFRSAFLGSMRPC